MLKKILLPFMFFGLTACGIGSYNSVSIAPKQTKPIYKISDNDVQKFIIEGNKIEQCIYPKIKKANNNRGILDSIYNAFTPEESYALQIEFDRTLKKIIGTNNVGVINSDYPSQIYLNERYTKFNHSKPVDMPANECAALRKRFNKNLANVRAESKKQQELARKQQIEYEKQRKFQEAALARQEKERQREVARQQKARADFLKTPQGQAYLAQQQLLQQQQAMQQQQLAQQRAMQQQQFAQQQAMRKRQDMQNLIDQMGQMNNQIRSQNNQFYQNFNNQMIFQNEMGKLRNCIGSGWSCY